MNGIEFVEMSREDIETHKNKETLGMVLQAVEVLVKENPSCEIAPTKTIEELWKKMKENASKHAALGMYVYDPESAAKFMREYLGIPEHKIVRLEDFL